MLRLFFFLSLIVSSAAMASPEEQLISIKERIRYSLWVNGLEQKQLKSKSLNMPHAKPLPEELERALQKI